MDDTTSRTALSEAETREEQRILSMNAWHLARYVIEHDDALVIPDDFDAGRFLYWAENYPELRTADKIQFVNQYARLEQLAKNVTARTLAATRIHGHGFFHAAFRTSVGQYLLFLGGVSALFVSALLVLAITGFQSVQFLIPFCAAGLGTCVFLLRVTQEKLTSREFDPAYIPSQLIRLGLGIMAGGSIVLFPDLLQSTSVLSKGVSVGQGSVAFILGYAVDVFYSVLDNVGGRIKNMRR